ncbi:MAG: uracil-DNA glycosylase [Halofilum sp. (in: g-proteobacteria)]|nr:uracil-DNA glycosylase [Halofilum sp. (in: g-proteobacteria)]
MGIPLWRARDAGDEAAPAAPEPGTAMEEPAVAPVTSSAPASAPDEPRAPEPPAAGAAEGDIAGMDLDTLEATIRACTACGLCESRTQAVPGVGHRGADLLVIGEAPGQEEDRLGEPFVGRAGQLLDRMLAAIGLDRETVYITNVLKCRPPNNRDPKPEEVRACSPYLRRQIELLRPRAILAVGRISAQQLLETGETVGRLRGRWHRFGPRDTPLLVTYHPAYLLRSPGQKRKSWADLKRVRAELNRPQGS